MIRAVVFDFFGVICSDDYWRFVRAEREGDTVFRTYADNVNMGKIHWQEFIDKVAESTKTSAETVEAMYRAEQINPMVVGLIQKLHQTYKTGLLTNAHHEFINGVLDKHHLRELFDEITISSEVGAMKPDPKIFQRCLDQLGLPAEEVLYIDDLERHVAAANEIGMHAIWYKDFGQLNQAINEVLTGA